MARIPISNGTIVAATGRRAGDLLIDRKGELAPGMDADVLVWDPNGHTTIGVGAKHHMNIDDPVLEGIEVDGKVGTVISRGMVVIESDTFTGRVGRGPYVPRGLSRYLR